MLFDAVYMKQINCLSFRTKNTDKKAMREIQTHA